MKTSFEPNDELCRLWQGQESAPSQQEVRRIMAMVETRARRFERKIFWRNAREYAAAVIVAAVFALFARHAETPLERVGHAIVSAGALWILLFAWLMQRSGRAPLPESSTAAYKRELLVRYDRQIRLTRHAWAWYVLPLAGGLILASLGQNHAPRSKAVMVGLVAVAGVVVAIVNRKAARAIEEEKRELEQLLETGKM